MDQSKPVDVSVHLKRYVALNQDNGIRLAHINVNGLFHKLDEIKLLIKIPMKVLAITETDDEIHMDNYILRWCCNLLQGKFGCKHIQVFIQNKSNLLELKIKKQLFDSINISSTA